VNKKFPDLGGAWGFTNKGHKMIGNTTWALLVILLLNTDIPFVYNETKETVRRFNAIVKALRKAGLIE